MAREYLKKATLTSTSDASNVHELVAGILNDIEAGGDAKALEYAAKFDKYEGNVLLTEAEIEAAARAEGGLEVCEHAEVDSDVLQHEEEGCLERPDDVSGLIEKEHDLLNWEAIGKQLGRNWDAIGTQLGSN